MKYTTVFAIITLGFIAACASAPKRVAQLDDARTKVQTLSQDPLAQQVASRELEAAREMLEQAETALKEREPQERVAHLAYLAGRNAEIGQARIDEAKAREEITQAEAKRNRVLLDARTQEVDTANQEADAAKQEASEAQAAAEAQAEEADAARRALAELQAKQTERGMVLTLSDVLFDTNAATLKPGATRALDRLAKFLDQNPDTRVIIEGHTDSRGSDAYNEDLSQRRAQAVSDELVSSGIASSRFEAIGRGEAFPVADNGAAAGRQQNRRVEIVFSDQSGRFAQGGTEGSLP